MAHRRLPAESEADDLHPVATGAKRGFETSLAVPKDTRYIEVEALDERGRVLRRSETARER